MTRCASPYDLKRVLDIEERFKKKDCLLNKYFK